jgi:hypothetical protein
MTMTKRNTFPKTAFLRASAPLREKKKKNSIAQRRRDAEKGLKDQDIQQACDHYLTITQSRLTIPQNATRSPKLPFSAPLRLCARKKRKTVSRREAGTQRKRFL